ncbi:unnamed protein product [Blepharisma stoltei]|uniref:Uncharacterized protein n=1 Tax=Blepharisma stoltei TaxID=1481888 RepID=A0AAU9JC79_9CILI|nr:unnamed protein product [Blepharisma stoltei]
MELNEEKGIDSLVLNCNKLAMDYLRQENYSESLQQLSRAQELLRFSEKSPISLKLLAITNNNIGCYYKKLGKQKLALQWLLKALNFDAFSSADRTNLAATHLNICAIYSQAERHDKALHHAITALQILKEVYDRDGPDGVINTLILVLYSAGVEYEFLNDIRKAEETYKCGLDMATQKLGNSHPLTQKLASSYDMIKNNKNNDKKLGKLNSSFGYAAVKSLLHSKIAQLDNTLPQIKSSNRRYNQTNRTSARPLSKNSKVKTPKSLENSMNRSEIIENAPSQQSYIQHNSARLSSVNPPSKARLVFKRGRSVPKEAIDQNSILKIKEKFGEIQAKINGFEKKFKPEVKKSETTQNNNKSLREKSATTIQKYWRGYIARKYYSKNQAKLKALSAVAELERIKKEGFGIFNEVSRTEKPDINYKNTTKKSEKEQKLQNQKLIPHKPDKTESQDKPNFNKSKYLANPLLKGYKGGNRIKRNLLNPIEETKSENKELSIVLIQAQIRKFLARRKFLKMKNSAIAIQKIVRRHQCRNLFQNIRNAVLYIQYYWRHYILKKKTHKAV